MKTMSKTILSLIAAAGIPALAGAAGQGNPTPVVAPVLKADAQALSDGEIKKVDQDAGKITVKHGRLANLDMPPMTMVFKVKDPAMLTQVKAGDKVKLTVEKINGALTITTLQAAP